MFLRPPATYFVLKEERKVARWRAHWAQMVRPFAENVPLLAALWLLCWGFASFGESAWFLVSVTWYAELAVLIRLALSVAHWWGDVVMITNKRIMQVTGIIRSDCPSMPVSKATDMKYSQSFWGHRLGYATFRFETAGQKQDLEYFPYVPDPNRVYEAVTKLVLGIGDEGLPPHRDGDAPEGPTLENWSDEWPSDGT